MYALAMLSGVFGPLALIAAAFVLHQRAQSRQSLALVICASGYAFGSALRFLAVFGVPLELINQLSGSIAYLSQALFPFVLLWHALSAPAAGR